MKLINLEKAARLLSLTEGQVVELLTEGIIKDGQIIDEQIYIPNTSIEYLLHNKHQLFHINELFDIYALSEAIHISPDTAILWVKLKKITPDRTYRGKFFFYRENILNLMNHLNSTDNSQLKARRNKIFKSGITLYENYLPKNSCNEQSIRQIFDLLKNEYKIAPTQNQINLILAECALQLLNQRLGFSLNSPSKLLIQYLTGRLNLGKCETLISKLLVNTNTTIEFIHNYPKLFEVSFLYSENEDLLGYLYLSISNCGERKKTGVYYTPYRVVTKLLREIAEASGITSKTVFTDPCCGSGNFLINLPDIITWENIRATDIDSNAILLCRINMMLKYPNMPVHEVIERITVKDYLSNARTPNYSQEKSENVIFGNPPWGMAYSLSDKKALSEQFECASPMNVESFALFIEQSIRNSQPGDLISFVVPESLLRVYNHLPIRKIIAKETSIKSCFVMGEQFADVTCPSIIITLQKQNENMEQNILRCKNAYIHIGTTESFIIENDRPWYNEFDILQNERTYKLLNKILNTQNCTTLTDNADWALGIVTGNNDKFLENEKSRTSEVILKGTNIDRYRINYKNTNYINFKPEEFQQVAKECFYRAPEKLFYKFICKNLVFAYDCRKLLSLNSANILIPKFTDLNIKYVLVVLNSDIANFIYNKKFKAVKVLRSQIESIPIKVITKEQQQYFIDRAELLINGSLNAEEEKKTEKEINYALGKLYDLTDDEIDYICN